MTKRPSFWAPADPDHSRVLVVDGSSSAARFVARMLQPEWEAVAATDGHEALLRLTAGDLYDVILVDLALPGVGAAAFLSHLSRHAPFLFDRVVVMTNGPTNEVERSFLASFSNEILERPFRRDELRAVVHRAAARVGAPRRSLPPLVA